MEKVSPPGTAAPNQKQPSCCAPTFKLTGIHAPPRAHATRSHTRGGRTGPSAVPACRKQYLHSCILHTNRPGLSRAHHTTPQHTPAPGAGLPSPPLRHKSPSGLRKKVLNTFPKTRLKTFPVVKTVTEGRRDCGAKE